VEDKYSNIMVVPKMDAPTIAVAPAGMDLIMSIGVMATAPKKPTP
jgi:hypothetical protein